jgi:hypothetical protein
MRKFHEMTIRELQDLRNKYSQRITEILKEFEEETGLEVNSVDQSIDGEVWSINIRKVI